MILFFFHWFSDFSWLGPNWGFSLSTRCRSSCSDSWLFGNCQSMYCRFISSMKFYSPTRELQLKHNPCLMELTCKKRLPLLFFLFFFTFLKVKTNARYQSTNRYHHHGRHCPSCAHNLRFTLLIRAWYLYPPDCSCQIWTGITHQAMSPIYLDKMWRM